MVTQHIRASAAAGSLTGSTLASGVTASSLTSVGTIASDIQLNADLDFVGAQAITTTAGNLSISVAAGADVLIGDDATILYVDGGTGTVGFGTPGIVNGGIRYGLSVTPGLNTNGFVLVMDASTLVEHSSGTHPVFVGLELRPPAVTSGSASVTDTATLRITDAMSVGTGGNYALWVDAGLSRFEGNIDLTNNHLLNVGGSGNDWTTTFTHTNSSAVATYAFNIRAFGGGGGLTVTPITQLASGSMEFFIQDFDTVTLTGSNPTAYTSVHAGRFQGFAYTATNAGQTVANARTLVLGPVNKSGVTQPTITTATTLYISSGGSAGATNYALFVDAGTSRFDGAISLVEDHGDDGQQLTSGGDDAACDWTAASSLKEHKDIGEQASPEEALEAMLSTPAYHFRYKERKGTGDSSTEYVGVMADEAPWAMHYGASIVNPVNTLGYTVLSVQALNSKIEKMEQELETLRS